MLTIYNATLRAAMAKAVLEASDDPGEALRIVQALSDPRPLHLTHEDEDEDEVAGTVRKGSWWDLWSYPVEPPKAESVEADLEPKFPTVEWSHKPPPKAEPAETDRGGAQGDTTASEPTVNPHLGTPDNALEPEAIAEGDDDTDDELPPGYWGDVDEPQLFTLPPLGTPNSYSLPKDFLVEVAPPETLEEAKSQARAFIAEHKASLEALAADEASERASTQASVKATQQCANPECEKRVWDGGYCSAACEKDHDEQKHFAKRSVEILQELDPKVRALELFQEVYPDCNRSEAISRYGVAAAQFWVECMSQARRERSGGGV